MTDRDELVIIVGPHSGLDKIGRLIIVSGLGMYHVVGISETDPGAICIAPMPTIEMPDPSPFIDLGIDNDPNQTHAHRERRLMLEKQARGRANRSR